MRFGHDQVSYEVIGDNTVSAFLSSVNGYTIPERALYTGIIPAKEYRVVSVGKLSNCSGIIIPSSFTSIGTIYNCSAITIPSSVTSIGSLVSHGSGNLALTIPSSVMSISEIDGDYGTIVLRMESHTPPFLGKIVGIDKTCHLIVPLGASVAYKKDPFWGAFRTIREDASLGQDKSVGIQTNISSNDEKDKEIAELKSQLAKLERQQVGRGETIVPSALGTSETEMKALDRLIDAALEDFVVTDEERATLLNKADSIGLNRDEFKMILDSKIQKRLKEKPNDRNMIEKRINGFFTRLFGKR